MNKAAAATVVSQSSSNSLHFPPLPHSLPKHPPPIFLPLYICVDKVFRGGGVYVFAYTRACVCAC